MLNLDVVFKICFQGVFDKRGNSIPQGSVCSPTKIVPDILKRRARQDHRRAVQVGRSGDDPCCHFNIFDAKFEIFKDNLTFDLMKKNI